MLAPKGGHAKRALRLARGIIVQTCKEWSIASQSVHYNSRFKDAHYI